GGVAARFFQHLGVLVDLAANDRTQPRHHVAADAAAAHHQAEHLALAFGDLVARHVLACHNDHRNSSRSLSKRLLSKVRPRMAVVMCPTGLPPPCSTGFQPAIGDDRTTNAECCPAAAAAPDTTTPAS